jgi:hypothetical protein
MDGSGTPEDPWQPTTAPGSSSYTMHQDETADPPLLEGLGLVELEHHARNNRVRAVQG